MKNNYLFKPIIMLFILLVMIAGTYSIGFSQNITIHTYAGYTPIEKNIAQGSEKNILSMFSVSLSGNATMTSVTYPTSGTITAGDIQSNGFKLWYSPYISSDNPLGSATVVATTSPVSAGSNIVFSGFSAPVNSSGVFYLTADIASGAVMGNFIKILSMPTTNVTFAAGTVVPGTIQEMNKQTIGIPLPIINVNYGYVMSQNVSAGSTEVTLYNFSIRTKDADATLNSITLPMKGNYTLNDFATNGIKLVLSSSSLGKTVISSASVVASGENLVFSGLNILIKKNEYADLNVVADLSENAEPGHTFGISAFPSSNLEFGPSQKINSISPSDGVLHTIGIPSVSILSKQTRNEVISAGSNSVVLYKMMITPVNSGAAFTQFKFTTGGNFQSSDIASNGFKLYNGDEDNYYSNDLVLSTDRIGSGEELVFDLPGLTLREDYELYLYLTVDIASSAASGTTIYIKPVTTSQVKTASGEVSLSTKAGSVKTVVSSSIHFTSLVQSAKTVSASSNVVLHTVKVEVSGAPLEFNKASFTDSGSYDVSDFTSYDNVYLMYHKTPNLVNELYAYDSVFVISTVTAMPVSGSPLTFDYMEYDTWYGINPRIPVGAGYISVLAQLSENPAIGHTIQLGTSGLSNFTFASGTKTGTLGTGGLMTIGKPMINLSPIAVPASRIAPQSSSVLYRIEANVSNANAVLSSATFTTGGNYSSSEVYGFSLYLSNDLTYNYYEDKYLGYASYVGPGGTLNFTQLNTIEFPVGTSYLVVVAGTTQYAAMGKTIHITETPLSNLTFVSGDVNGVVFPEGGVQTFAKPSSIDFSTLNVPARKIMVGAKDNVIYSFSLTPNGAPALLSQVSIPTGGSFKNYELQANNAFQLYYNSVNSFEGSTPIGEIYEEISSGDDIKITYIAHSIPEGETAYFFLTVNIGNYTSNGTTIKVNGFDMSAIEFTAGEATGNGLAGSTFEFQVPTAQVTFPDITVSQLVPASKNNVLFRLNMTAEISDMNLNYLTLSTAGTYSDIDVEEVLGFKLYYNSNNTFEGSVNVSSGNAVNSGDKIEFYIDNLLIKKGATGYFFVTADISSSATESNTIRIDMSPSDKVNFVAGVGVGYEGKIGEVFEIGTVTSITNENTLDKLVIYPNPSKQNTTVTISSGNNDLKVLTIYNAAGSIVKTFESSANVNYIDNLNRGIYMIKIQDYQTEQMVTKKLIVE